MHAQVCVAVKRDFVAAVKALDDPFVRRMANCRRTFCYLPLSQEYVSVLISSVIIHTGVVAVLY